MYSEIDLEILYYSKMATEVLTCIEIFIPRSNIDENSDIDLISKMYLTMDDFHVPINYDTLYQKSPQISINK